jgi:hypothetical protein
MRICTVFIYYSLDVDCFYKSLLGAWVLWPLPVFASLWRWKQPRDCSNLNTSHTVFYVVAVAVEITFNGAWRHDVLMHWQYLLFVFPLPPYSRKTIYWISFVPLTFSSH